MSQFSEEDRSVAEFLRQYSPSVPPAEPELENRIIQAIPLANRRPKRSLGLISAALAASFLAAIATNGLMSSRSLSEAEVVQLEAYVERHWGEFAIGSEGYLTEADVWLFPDSTLMQEN